MSCSGASSIELAVMRALAGDPVAIDAVDAWPSDTWPPSVSIDGRLHDQARFTIRWHYLPDHPAYREEVRVVTESAAIELEFPSPYLMNAPTLLRVSRLDGDDRSDTVFRSVRRSLRAQSCSRSTRSWWMGPRRGQASSRAARTS